MQDKTTLDEFLREIEESRPPGWGKRWPTKAEILKAERAIDTGPAYGTHMWYDRLAKSEDAPAPTTADLRLLYALVSTLRMHEEFIAGLRKELRMLLPRLESERREAAYQASRAHSDAA